MHEDINFPCLSPFGKGSAELTMSPAEPITIPPEFGREAFGHITQLSQSETFEQHHPQH